jgi:hypothetical protein
VEALQQLPATDLATLTVIQQYAAFRQGEVWQDIQAGFRAEGLQLTQEDRCVELWVCWLCATDDVKESMLAHPSCVFLLLQHAT